jgi:ABC-2 type transport system ATP-binding protein
MSILLENVSRRFDEQWAVDHISFEVRSGEIAGFIGPNGAGKSTTMKIITGVLPATSGTVRINGIDIQKNLMKIKKSIGYLPENNPLYHDMYVKEYLLYVAGLYGINGKSAANRVKEIIEQVGLTPERKKKIGMLSKGYRQRVGISQALIHDPDVLILDEPTSGLDPNQIIEIRNLISTVGKEKTVLLSTHIMQEVEAICDRVIIIDHGKIKANDTAARIATKKEGMQTIQVELETAVDPALWKTMTEIRDVRVLPGNLYLLAADPDNDIRSRVFKFAVQQDLTILSMAVREKSLEEVFRELTS